MGKKHQLGKILSMNLNPLFYIVNHAVFPFLRESNSNPPLEYSIILEILKNSPKILEIPENSTILLGVKPSFLKGSIIPLNKHFIMVKNPRCLRIIPLLGLKNNHKFLENPENSQKFLNILRNSQRRLNYLIKHHPLWGGGNIPYNFWYRLMLKYYGYDIFTFRKNANPIRAQRTLEENLKRHPLWDLLQEDIKPSHEQIEQIEQNIDAIIKKSFI